MVQRVLVAYGSKYGATAEIAQAIASVLAQAGLSVDVRPARDVRALQPYGAVVLGSAVYLGRWRRDALRLLCRADLAGREVWLFSSGPAGPDPEGGFSDRWTTPKRVTRRADQLNAREYRVFGGRISAESGGFMRRSMARSSPVTFFVVPDQGAVVARLGMAYAPSRTHDPGGGVTGPGGIEGPLIGTRPPAGQVSS